MVMAGILAGGLATVVLKMVGLRRSKRNGPLRTWNLGAFLAGAERNWALGHAGERRF